MERRGLDEVQLCRLGRALGSVMRSGEVALLVGPMGAGKTTLTRAIAVGLGVDRPDRVRSPTFNICIVHPGPTPLVHVDLFRLAQGASPAFEALGLEPLTDRGAGAVVIEWADLWRDPPADGLSIELARVPGAPQKRDLNARASEGSRLLYDRWSQAAAAADTR